MRNEGVQLAKQLHGGGVQAKILLVLLTYRATQHTLLPSSPIEVLDILAYRYEAIQTWRIRPAGNDCPGGQQPGQRGSHQGHRNEQQIPVKYLEQILLTLKNAGLLNSKMGLNGGYYLSAPPESITLGHIIRVLDGPLAPIRCVSQMAYEPCGCPDEETCGLRLIMLDVRNASAEILDHTTLADVTARIEQARTLSH